MATTKAAVLDKRQTLSMLERFFHTFQNCCNQKGAIQASLLEPYLAKNFRLTSNDRTIAKTLSEYLNRLGQFQKKFSHIEVAGPAAEPIIDGNRIAIQYNVDYTLQNGEKNEVSVMAFVTLEDNKVTAWSQVTHEKGSGVNWDQ